MYDDAVARSADEIAQRARSGRSRDVWQPAETLLAMVVAVYVDPSKLGGTKTRTDGTSSQHSAVLATAHAIGRSPDAVVMKVMNLRSVLTGGDRGLPSVARLDRETVARYAGHLDVLIVDAVTVAHHLPGAAEVIDAIVPRSIAAGLDDDGSGMVRDAGPEPETERILRVAQRRGQGVFRGRVLSNYAHTCAFCRLRSRLPEQNSYLLLASHIRPWKDSSGHQRLDPANGLSLCAIHDRAFDWGFLTVDADLRVVASRHAHDHYEPEDRVRSEILDLHGVPLFQPDREYLPPGAEYLRHHREEVFEQRFRRGA